MYVYINIHIHIITVITALLENDVVFASFTYFQMINKLYTIDAANSKIYDDCRCTVTCML